MDTVTEVKRDLMREEEELKQYFQESQKPVANDPTLTSKYLNKGRERYEQKQEAFREVVKDI